MKIARRNRRRTYSLNENAFGRLTLESCYWAGYIAADGCIKYSKYNTRGILSFHINKRDKIQLELLKLFIGANNPIYQYVDDSIELSIRQINKMALDLKAKYNITERKSLTLKPPHLSGNMALAFIVGYLDGDGCITSCHGKRAISFRGTKAMLSWIQKAFDKLYISDHYCSAKPVFSHGYWSYTVAGNRAEIIGKLLRNILVPKMKRKWSKLS